MFPFSSLVSRVQISLFPFTFLPHTFFDLASFALAITLTFRVTNSTFNIASSLPLYTILRRFVGFTANPDSGGREANKQNKTFHGGSLANWRGKQRRDTRGRST